MKINKIFLLLITIYSLSSILKAQTQNDRILARVGNTTIMESEFLERFELNPQIGLQTKGNNYSIKLKFLYTLIAEKLWALKSENDGLDRNTAVQTAVGNIEKMFVRDALYRQVIKNKIKISKKELERGLLRNSYKLKVNFLFSDNKNKIYSLYKLLNTGFPFDSILVSREEYKEQLKPIEVSYGQMLESAEDSIYKLEIGQYTKPLLTPDGWYIFKLDDKIKQVFGSANDRLDAENKVKKVIRHNKERKLYDDFYINFFNKRKVNVNSHLFKSLFNKIIYYLGIRKQVSNSSHNELFHLEVQDVLKIEKAFGADSLKMDFILFKKHPVTLKHFLRDLIFNDFSVEKVDPNIITESLNKKVQKYIEDELLAREGYRRGLNLLPSVKREVQMWKDNYLAQALKSEMTDTVKITNKELKRYYNQKFHSEKIPTQLKIVEILVKDLQTSNEIINKVKKGKDIRKLAVKYSIMPSAKKNKGELGWFPALAYGEVGRIASKMNIGEVYGPLKTKKGYSIFKLIAKKKEKIEPPSKSFSEIKNSLKTELAQKKLYKELIKRTVSFAKQTKISINYNLLKEIKPTNINSFAIRHMGFGGKITAVPILAPFYDWVNILKSGNQILP